MAEHDNNITICVICLVLTERESHLYMVTGLSEGTDTHGAHTISNGSRQFQGESFVS